MTYSDTYYGGVRRWYSDPPEDAGMRIADDIKRAVCFLSVRLADGSYYNISTAFFIHTPYEVDPTQHHLFVVTARHSIEGARKAGHDALYLRINTVDETADYYQVNREWVTPRDYKNEEHAFWNYDVAVALLDHIPPSFTYMALPHDMGAQSQRASGRRIGIGDDLYILGLFKKREGRTRNIPILRSGIIAATPEEVIPETITNEQGEKDVRYYHAYLAEVRSIKGLSGSPVFVLLHPYRPIFDPSGEKIGQTENYEMYTLGLIRGRWNLETFEAAIDCADEDEDNRINTGIATVTPFRDVLNVINGKEMMKKRQEKEREYVKQRETTLDAASPPVKSDVGITQEGFQDALERASRKASESEPEKNDK